jgi:hypothetical protein
MPGGADWGTVALEVDVARIVRALRATAADAVADAEWWPAEGPDAHTVRAELLAVAEELGRVAAALEAARDVRTLVGSVPILIDGWHTVNGYRAWVR